MSRISTTVLAWRSCTVTATILSPDVVPPLRTSRSCSSAAGSLTNCLIVAVGTLATKVGSCGLRCRCSLVNGHYHFGHLRTFHQMSSAVTRRRQKGSASTGTRRFTGRGTGSGFQPEVVRTHSGACQCEAVRESLSFADTHRSCILFRRLHARFWTSALRPNGMQPVSLQWVNLHPPRRTPPPPP
jgi:hypothetical protein